ncbi:MAG: glucosamine-6-phosphate deaminase [Bacteroidota bacterium]|nr:glucosamine-6-phosphate deaminase [Bacteroidota bacterium]
MVVSLKKDEKEAGKAAGKKAAAFIREAIQSKGSANIILATGSSQFETLKQLTSEKDIDWSKVTMFHLDEYIGLPVSHKASFRKYLQERFVEKVPKLKAVNFINGEAHAQNECERLGKLIDQLPVDVALVGIGENGHLAFNDPPADFETDQSYLIVNLDEECRQQQVNEGWFNSIEEVPKQAISMSIKQIMLSQHIICTVPGRRKAKAIQHTLEEDVSNLWPASILQQHSDCYLYLDNSSASFLKNKENYISPGA